MANQLQQSRVTYSLQDTFTYKLFQRLSTHNLVSYITQVGTSGKLGITQFVLALQDGRYLIFNYKATPKKAEILFYKAALDIIRFYEHTGELPLSVLGNMIATKK